MADATDKKRMGVPPLISFYRWIWRFWRAKRFQRFVDAIRPERRWRVLDVGGTSYDWIGRGWLVDAVDVLNLEHQAVAEHGDDSPRIRSLKGDARRLEIEDEFYDLVFSNSVIEHVGTLEDQQAFAEEARRVGRALWIQTPAKGCPIEPHYLGLCIHWFPHRWHVFLARWTSLTGLTRSASPSDLAAIAASTRLIAKREFREMFPDCEIWTERFLWVFPKSYVAIRKVS